MDDSASEKNELIDSSTKELEYPTKRWGIITIVTMLLFLDVFCISFFGFINDLTSTYFEVSPALTDLLSSLNLLARAFSCIFLVLAGRFLNFRSLATIISGTVIIGDFLIITGLDSRRNFAIVAMGQILNGAGATIALTMAQMAASNWFPKNQRGIAIAMPRIFRKLSPLVSNLVATRSFNFDEAANTTDYMDDKNVLLEFRKSFQSSFAVLASIGILGFLLSLFYMKDYPEGHEQSVPSTDDQQWTLVTELRNTWRSLKDKRYPALVFFYVAYMAIRPTIEWMLSSVVLQVFPEKGDQDVGIMFYVGYTVGACGGPAAGFAIDKFKRQKIIFGAGICLITLSVVVFSLALTLKLYPLLYVGYTSTVFFQIFGMICVSHFLVDLKMSDTPAAKIRSFGVAITFSSLSQALFTEITRGIIASGYAQFAPMSSVPLYIASGIVFMILY